MTAVNWNKDFREKYAHVLEETPEGCLVWTGTKGNGGYGMLHYHGSTQLAHRVSYNIYYDRCSQQLCVCHTCNNRACVLPEHLTLQTHKWNTQDAINKGTLQPFERTISDEDIEEARIMRNERNMTWKEIGLTLGCSPGYISKLVQKGRPSDQVRAGGYAIVSFELIEPSPRRLE